MLREDVEFIPCLRVLIEFECNLMTNMLDMIKWHGQALYVV